MNGGIRLGIELQANNKAGAAVKGLTDQLDKLKGSATQAGQAVAKATSGAPQIGAGAAGGTPTRDAKGRFIGRGGSSAGGGGGGAGPAGAAGVAAAVAGHGHGGHEGGADKMAFMQSLEVVGAYGEKLRAVGDDFIDVAKAGGEFTRALNVLQATSDATESQMAAMRAAAIRLGPAYGVSAKEAVEAMTSLASAGLNAQESMSLLEQSLQIVVGSGGKLNSSQAAGLVSQTMKMWGLSADQAVPALDKAAQMAGAFAANIEDIPTLLANSSKGTVAMKAGVTDTMVALGLVKNLIPSVQDAATAAGNAMFAIARPETIRALKAQGIEVQTTAGKFRAFPDIVQDLIPKLEKMTEVDAAGFMQKTFGDDAGRAIGLMITQLRDGIKDADGNLRKGGDAIAYLRGQIDNSGGALKKFSDANSDGFAIIKASWETLKQAFGSTLGKTLAPVLQQVSGFVQRITGLWEGLSPKTKESVGKIVGAIVGLVTAFGALLSGGAAVAALITALETIGTGGAVVFAAFAAVFGLVATAIAGFKTAYEKNVGGFADSLGKVKDALTAVYQLLSTGDVDPALLKDEAVANFVSTVGNALTKVENLFEGIKSGFVGAVEAMKPQFEMLSDTFHRLLDALGLTADGTDGAKASFESFKQTGESIGKGLGKVFEMIVGAVKAAMEAAIGFKSKWEDIKGALAPVSGALDNVWEALKRVGVSLGILDPSGASSGWQKFGKILGDVVQTVSHYITDLVRMFSGLIVVVGAVVDFVSAIFQGNWSKAWNAMKRIALGVIQVIFDWVSAIPQTIADAIQALVDAVPQKWRGKLGLENFNPSKFVQDTTNDVRSDLDKAIAQTYEDDKKADEAAKAAESQKTGQTQADTLVQAANTPAPGSNGQDIAASVQNGLAGTVIQNNVTLKVDSEEVKNLLKEHESREVRPGAR